ncbi:MAG: divalent-cation tolerance protein CutA [Candidatus Omnitrophota bacterium]
MEQYVIVFVTVSNQQEAEKIASLLVKKRLVACVNIIPEIKSIYRWKGKIERAKELFLILKSKKNLIDLLCKEIKKNHSYEVPEIIAIDIVKGYLPYLEWLKKAIK